MSDAVSIDVRVRADAPIPLDVALAAGPRDVAAVFGPSGAGKTTLLRTIAGLHRQATGRIVCRGVTWLDTDRGVCLPPHERRLGFVAQDYGLFPHLDALHHVAIALGHLPRDQRRAEAARLLALVHLESSASRRPASLSGGEQQRLAIARAIARNPHVLLLDEPFAAVDRATRRALQDELDALRHRLDMPIVLVTHDFEDVIRLASHVTLLERGHVVAAGAVGEITSRVDLPWLAAAAGRGSVFTASVDRVDERRKLADLRFDGGTLIVPAGSLTSGRHVRVRVPAREIILATSRPEGLSLHNILEGRVSGLESDERSGVVIVQIAVGETHLLAEVTGDAVDRLAIAIGRPILALIKSVAIEVG